MSRKRAGHPISENRAIGLSPNETHQSLGSRSSTISSCVPDEICTERCLLAAPDGMNSPSPALKEMTLPSKLMLERAFQHVADVAGLAPVLGAVARLELDQANLPRPFAVDLLADVRADLLPRHVLEAHFERTQARPPRDARSDPQRVELELDGVERRHARL